MVISKKFKLAEKMSLNQDYVPMIRKLAIKTMLGALAIVTSTTLVFIPNLETMSLIIFLVSTKYGLRDGLEVVVVAAILYEIIVSTIYGSSGIIFPFKLLGYSIIAILGALLKPEASKLIENHKTLATFIFGFLGFFSAFIFDICVTIGYTLYLNAKITDFLTLFIIGLPFEIVHWVSSTILFALIPSIWFILPDIEMEEDNWKIES